MKYLGNYKEDYTDLNFKFSTHEADGTPITLAGTPAVSVYKSNSTTQSTAGVTLSVDFDGVTGLHNVNIDLSADAFYEVGEDYSVVITTGTVDSVSVVGTVLAHFSIENRFDEADVVKWKGATAEAMTGDAYAAVGALNDISAADVWSVETRTLSSFGTLVADIATAVWGAGSGDHAWTYGPVNVDGQPQADATVQVYSDSGYTTRLYIGKTDDTGYVTFHTDLAEETQTYQTIDVPGLAREYDDEKVVYD